MRIVAPIVAVSLLALAASASAQNQPQGGMMMCAAPATTGQGAAEDKTSKPMQMGMMCPCCQAMMKKKGMMQKDQKGGMPDMPDMPK